MDCQLPALESSRDVFLTSLSRPVSSYLPRGVLASLQGGVKASYLTGRSVTPAAAVQNDCCGSTLSVLDELGEGGGDSKGHRLAMIQNLKNMSATKPLSQAFTECVALLDSRGSGAESLTTQLSLKRGESYGNAMQSQIFKSAAAQSSSPVKKQMAGGSKLRKWIETLKINEEQRDKFFITVDAIHKGRMVDGDKKNYSKTHVETVGRRYTPKSRWRRRERLAIEREKRTKTAQQRAKALSDKRVKKTEETLRRPDVRKAQRFDDEKRQTTLLALAGSWSCIITLCTSILSLRGALETVNVPNGQPQPTPKNTRKTSAILQHDEPRPGAIKAFVKMLKRVAAVRKIKQFIRDYHRTTRIPLSIRIYIKAVVTVQRNFRALVLIRNYRRFICSLQWDSVVDEMVKEVDEKIQVLQGGKKKDVGKELNDLQRERGELRGIPLVVKADVISASTKKKEEEYGTKVVQYLRGQERIEEKVKEWMCNERFLEAALERKTDVTLQKMTKKTNYDIHNNFFAVSGGRNLQKIPLERQRALDALRTSGEQLPIPAPVFPVVTNRNLIHELVQNAILTSRTLVKQRLAANDVAMWCDSQAFSRPGQ